MWVDPRAGRRKFSAFAAAAVEPRSNVRPATSARIASYLRVQIVPAFGEVALGKITRLSVQGWIDSMTQVLGALTVRDAYRVFAGFKREAVRQGLIRESPCYSIERGDFNAITCSDPFEQLACILSGPTTVARIENSHHSPSRFSVARRQGPQGDVRTTSRPYHSSGARVRCRRMTQPAGRRPVPIATVVRASGDERGIAIEDAEGEVTILDELWTQVPLLDKRI
jgi:hypothetical protein